ncbi:MAG: fatty acid desaturase, partial [Waterburya sp.]
MGNQSAISMENSFLKVLQRRWAFVTIIIPSLGFVVAIGQILYFGVSFVEIELLVSMYALTIIGVELGFHRHFSHRAFQANIIIRCMLAILGSMAAQGPLIYWVANHRRHHQYSEQSEDPHSPYIYEGKKLSWLHGLWHSHLGWMINSKMTNSTMFAKDILKDQTLVKVNQLYLFWVILGLVIPAVLGGLL